MKTDKKEKDEAVVQYEMWKTVSPGMYVYADGFIYPEIIEGRRIKAVVGFVNASKILAVCLREEYLPWSSDFLMVRKSLDENNGKEATRLILEASHRERKLAEAAEWCYEYDKDGVKQGEAFLPSMDELRKLSADIDIINVSLEELGGFSLSGDYWSSSEHSNCDAWRLFPCSGGTCYLSKGSMGYVRPVLAITL